MAKFISKFVSYTCILFCLSVFCQLFAIKYSQASPTVSLVAIDSQHTDDNNFEPQNKHHNSKSNSDINKLRKKDYDEKGEFLSYLHLY